VKRCLYLWPLATLPLSAASADRPPGTPVRVVNGSSTVDFTADGKSDLIVSARRENFNAHGFDVVTFYIHADDGEPQSVLHIVPIFRAGHEEQEVTVSGGADCVLHDFRLLAGPKPTSATLILANRDIGDGYAAAGRVTFTFLELKKNVRGEVGDPLYAFVQSHVAVATTKYCDVGEAFERELDL